MKKLTILGASGHGKVIADIARLNGYDEIEFLDDDSSKKECAGYPVVGACADAANIDNDLFVAIGDKDVRRQFIEMLHDKTLPTLVHPSAVIAEGVRIGRGTVIMAGAVVNPCAEIGTGCIINTCSSLDHDCVIGDYVHISVGARLCGTVRVGKGTWISAGSVIINNIDICEDCLVGAGTVVIRDLRIKGTYIGVPARLIPNRAIDADNM